MNRILTSAEMFLCDRTEIETNTPSRVLMHRAAAACADEIEQMLREQPSRRPTDRVVILCGGGNNGGDGILCAKLLCERGIHAVICPAFSDGDRLSDECAFRYKEATAAQVPILSAEEFVAYAAAQTEPITAAPCSTSRFLPQTPAKAELSAAYEPPADPCDICLIVDALFGIGLTRPITGVSAALIDAANDLSARKKITTAAIDIASGIFADTGKCDEHTFRADRTLAINHAKIGHLLYPGAASTGILTVLDIGIPETPLHNSEQSFPVHTLTDDDVRALLPRRLPDSNKGTHGRILIAAGCRTMCGAAYLSALAAYRCGAGLVEIFTDEANRIPLLTLLPEAILTVYDPCDPDAAADALKTALKRATAAVIGPGLGTSDTAKTLVQTMLEHTRVPTVVDADALNILAAHPELRPAADAPLIFTPHPGELSRLTGLPVAACTEDPVTVARETALARGIVLNAKNTRSVITDGSRAFINPTGTSALAKGGSGDVLTGITATLAAQMCRPKDWCNVTHKDSASGQECNTCAPKCSATQSCNVTQSGTAAPNNTALIAAALAAYLHGRAAELVSARMGTRSPLASEIADALAEVFVELGDG